jgi:5-methyltetrahydrofolate--homocysteine methyltransferase
VFKDAQAMLEQLIAEKWIDANAVFALFPAQAVGDDIVFYADEARDLPLMTWHGLRQQQERPEGKPNQCLSDFVASGVGDGGTADYAGAFAVTAGLGIESKLAEFAVQHDDYRAIMLKSLADRLAEAAAEWLHERVRKDYWGYAANESLDTVALVAEKYRGIRPAPGYPACPDHTSKAAVFDLLDAPRNAGMGLTETYAMTPAASVAGFYLAHPEARYFAVGKIGRDQLQDWAQRNNMTIQEAEKWLAPLL